MDMLALASDNECLKMKVKVLEAENCQLKKVINEKDKMLKEQEEKMKKTKTLSVELVQLKESKLKNLFKFYTGITYVRFLGLLAFLVPSFGKIDYKCKRTDLKNLCNNCNNCVIEGYSNQLSSGRRIFRFAITYFDWLAIA